jgi:hypothetical protein
MGALTTLSRQRLSEYEDDPAWYAGMLDRISDGNPPYVLAKEAGLTWRAFLTWVRADEDRNKLFLEAQAIGAQKMVDESLEIADSFETEGNDTSAFKAKLQIDTRLKIAGKLDPRFGNGPNVAVQGTNIQVVMTDFRNFAPESDVLESE